MAFKLKSLKTSEQKNNNDKTISIQTHIALTGSRSVCTEQGVVIDSGACSHVANSSKQLVSMQPARLTGIRDLSGQISKVKGMGNVSILYKNMLSMWHIAV